MKNIEFNTQICTTIEQSKRLLELGLNANTADMSWTLAPISSEYPHASLIPYSKTMYRLTYNILPAWSLHRLIAMLPDRDRAWLTDYCDFKDCSKIYGEVISLIEWMIENEVLYKEYLKEE